MNFNLRFLLLLFTFSIFHQTSSIAEIRYVSHTGTSTPPYTTWETAADSIQKCINISQFGDIIYVAAGVYKEKIIMINGLTLIGAGIDSSVIDTRELAQPSSFYALEFFDSCLVKGFSINVSFGNIGIGIRALGSVINPINGIIDGNKIFNAVYGVSIENGNVVIKNNVIINVERGVIIGAAYPNYFPIIEYNYISATSFGVQITVGTTPVIRNNIFYLNDPFSRAYQGGGSDTAKIYNNIAYADTAQTMYSSTLVPTLLINNVAYGNFVTGIRFGSYENNYNIAKNNLVMGGQYGLRRDSGNPIAQYNDSWNNQVNYYNFTPDSTNLSIDPMIVNENSNDFHLQMFSPLIDAGDPSILDIDGSRSDIGVFGGPYGEKYTYHDLAPKPPANLTAVYPEQFYSS